MFWYQLENGDIINLGFCFEIQEGERPETKSQVALFYIRAEMKGKEYILFSSYEKKERDQEFYRILKALDCMINPENEV